MVYEEQFRVGARDIDPFNQCRPSSLMNFLQEAATAAAVELHVAREDMRKGYGMFWMMARAWYELRKPVFWNDTLTIRTWHRGGRGAMMYRDFDICRGGEPIGEAVNVWVLADIETHKLRRLEDIRAFDGTSGGALCRTRPLPKLRIPVALRPAEERRLHYSDCDVNGHVNNVRYLDFACDALHMQTLGEGRFLSAVQIGYLKECRAEETLRLLTGGEGARWFVRGDGEEKSPRFEASLTLSPLDKPGTGA